MYKKINFILVDIAICFYAVFLVIGGLFGYGGDVAVYLPFILVFSIVNVLVYLYYEITRRKKEVLLTKLENFRTSFYWIGIHWALALPFWLIGIFFWS